MRHFDEYLYARMYFWACEGTFGRAHVVLGKCGYSWVKAGTFGLCSGTFGRALVLLGVCLYFWAHEGTQGCARVL